MPKKISQKKNVISNNQETLYFSQKYRLVFTVVLSLCIAGIIAILANLWFQIRCETLRQNSLIAVAQLNDRITKQSETLDDLQKDVKQTLLYKEKTVNNWLLLKSYYAVETAKFYLTVERNIDSAIKILSQAEHELEKSNSIVTQNIRNVLAKDIDSLKNAPKIDFVKTTLALEDLHKKITALATPTKVSHENPKPDTASPSQTEGKARTLWHNFLKKSKAILSKAMLIHKQDSAAPVLNHEQKESVILDMRYRVKIAEWAFMHHEEVLYQANLQQVADDIDLYFKNTNPSQATECLHSVQDLQKINLSQTLPNLDHSEQAIETAIIQ